MKRKKRNQFAGMISLLLLLNTPAFAPATEEERAFDVVVVGSTPAGVAAAVNAAEAGVEVALLSDDHHVGGLTSGGLSNTDFRYFQTLGGTWRDFMERVVAYYAAEYGPDSPQLEGCKHGGFYEPGVARKVFEEMLADAGVEVLRYRLPESAEVIENEAGRRQIVGLTCRDTQSGELENYKATVFIDATYEGDVLALAGGAYAIGNVQTYSFRICMTSDKSNQIPIAAVKPEKFEQLNLDDFRQQILSQPDRSIYKLVLFRMDINGKADVNTRAYTPEFHYAIDGNGWTEGTREYRQAMYDLAKTTAQGFFYFLATDPALADHPIQAEINEWGYAADEYPENDHWTPELYVREGRKMKGVYKMTRADREIVTNSVRARAHPDAVASHDYLSVAHGKYNDFGLAPTDFLEEGAVAVREWPEQLSDGEPRQKQWLELELPEMQGTAEDKLRGSEMRELPYEIVYGAIVPVSLDGLLVPVALSADNYMFNTIRMEPAWTALGQAAGVAAALSIRDNVPPREVDTDLLRRALHAQGAKTFYAADVDRRSPFFRAVQYFGNLGYFHATDLISTNTRYPAPVERVRGDIGTQWRGQSIHWHDVLPDQPLTEEVETFWRQRTLEQFGAEALEGFEPTSNSSLTRGEYLNSLLAHLGKTDPA
jgi:hypothetical protein